MGVLLVLSGCSAIPPGGDPGLDPRVRALAASDAPLLGKLAIVPAGTVGLASTEETKGWAVAEHSAFQSRGLDRALESAFQASGRYARVRVMREDDISEAYANADDVIARLTVHDLETTFEGRNGWWIPNLVNWFMFLFPAWWVATEDFSLAVEATLSFESAETGKVLASELLRADVSGSFDEFDRGWHPFGFVYTPLEGENWLKVAALLFPEARRQLAVAAARRAAEVLPTVFASKDFAERTRKTLVLAIGVSRYADPLALPELPLAAGDARGVVDTLAAGGVRADHVRVLLDGAATVAAVSAQLEELLARARPDDNVLVHFSGYGARGADGAPQLVLHDAKGDAGEGRLAVSRLLELLGGLPGRKLVVLDTAFDGGSRSVGSAGAGAGALALGSEGGVALLVAGHPGEPALAHRYLGHGLLSWQLLRALEDRRADANEDGRLVCLELYNAIRAKVVAEAALLGSRQEPLLVAGERSSFFAPTCAPAADSKGAANK